ncbi:GNAT family N-acetyltransferase [Kitasatospora camelliae]|uniref:GNAT family N-acetyltransferase n=1 Tax=Kitasatospora camelliae TaxID=3156397 RepID=A0AAU8JSI0_9ACTN
MSSYELTIRPATFEDDEELVELNRVIWSRLSEVSPKPAEGARMFDERHPPEQYRVAELDGRIVGFVRQVPPTPLATNGHVRQIQGLGVLPDVRGRGVGDALVDAACDAAREAGARRLTLRVLAHNTPARRLYERHGFRIEGTLHEEFLLDGTYVDDIWMARSL